VPANRLVCPHCKNWRTTLVSGDEMVLQQVELERYSREAAPAAIPQR
jgi:Zn finger protein HypA/HybF involved in hydrogenase expression